MTNDAEGRGFAFNGENKQTVVSNAGTKVAEYFYDGENKRVKKKVFHADGITPKEETVFVYSAGKLIAEYSTAAPAQNATTSYTATDQLGSPRVITDSFGQVVSRRDFMPFGEKISNNIGERTASFKYGTTDSVRQKFTTYHRDEETKLDFAEARMYENRHARFTAVDPLLASGKSSNPQTFNRFVYVMNNPQTYVDPSGLQAGSYSGKVYTNLIQTQFITEQQYQSGEFEGFFLYEGGNQTFTATNLRTYELSNNGWIDRGNVFVELKTLIADAQKRGNYLPQPAPAPSPTPMLPIRERDPVAEQCQAICELLAEEEANGTFAAAQRYSVTFGTEPRIALNNRAFGDLPDGNGGRIDQDWWMDLQVQTGPVKNPKSYGINDDFQFERHITYKYIIGKFLTGVGNLRNGTGSTYPIPYTDPGERAAINNVINGKKFKDVFTPDWTKRYCGGCEK